MSSYSIHTIAELLKATTALPTADAEIKYLCIDSRRVVHPPNTLFFALQTARRNGHAFIRQCYEKGVRNFVVSEPQDASLFPGAVFLYVTNTTISLQQLAVHHRKQFSIPVIGITGSNGKTIVKEWLYQLLSDAYSIARSPKSYNSQVGVPLSVWQLESHHTLGIFEAGISEAGEMQALQQIIQPTIGVFTNLGDAHKEGFSSDAEKFHEKAKLFNGADVIIYSPEQCKGFSFYDTGKTIITWGTKGHNDLHLLEIQKSHQQSILHFKWKEADLQATVPFSDDASLHNILTCICVCLHLQMPTKELLNKLQHLKPVSLRLELKKGIHYCTIINDSYSADVQSFEPALNFLLQQQQHAKKTIILSDIAAGKEQEAATYQALAQLFNTHGITRVISVGTVIQHYFQELLAPAIAYTPFNSVEELIQHIPALHLHEEAILIKGARSFGLEQLMPLLEQQVHQTVLEINLTAIAHNIKAIRSLLKPNVKLMAMVKAFSYGSGSYEIANLLQYHGADYLAVAFADEGVELRKAGITLPIMVMNPEAVTFDSLVTYNLEPELYSPEISKSFAVYLEQEGLHNFPVHIKIDTGMHRLGFMKHELPVLIGLLQRESYFSIQSVFSHLAAAEDGSEDAFTQQQAALFEAACNTIATVGGADFLKHISNTSGIMRHAALQYDMVRAGIGMFGIAAEGIVLEEALALKTTVAQIKHLEPGETVGYNRKGVISKPTIVATVRIGYADGYPRNLSNGVGHMVIKGKHAPVLGKVCMDMTMLDVTNINGVQEGDEVLVFGKGLSINKIAEWSGTIPYEIMSGISQRVKRVYFEE